MGQEGIRFTKGVEGRLITITRTENMSIVLSVKPAWADLIYKGIKKYELRKSLYPLDVSHSGGIPERMGKIYIYETRPIKKITGYIIVDNFLWNMSLDKIWNYVKDEAAMTRDQFDIYYMGSKEGRQCAWHIKEAVKYSSPIDPNNIQSGIGWHPPRSWMHISDSAAKEMDDVAIKSCFNAKKG